MRTDCRLSSSWIPVEDCFVCKETYQSTVVTFTTGLPNQLRCPQRHVDLFLTVEILRTDFADGGNFADTLDSAQPS